MKKAAAKKNAKKETRHLPNPRNAAATVCGKPIDKILLWAKTTPPKADDPSVCKRCLKLADHGRIASPKSEKKADAFHQELNAYEADKAARATKAEKKEGKRQPALLILGDRMPKQLFTKFKGEEYVATVNNDGTIFVEGIGLDGTFNSPSRAGKAVTGREVDGWTFWSYTKGDGSLAKINELRK